MSRINKNSAAARGEHPAQQQDSARRNDEGTAMSLEERMALVRNEFVQEALPKAPDLAGYHTCWLSTNHSYDPIDRRLRLGYELVQRTEVTGFDHMKSNSGDYGDNVMCNEMILAKIPLELYQAIMQEFHHERPLREEQSINERIAQASAEDKSGKPILVREEGMEERTLVSRRPAPMFGA